ncbi:MAG: hypothetical protein Wins2KO_30130 [Winogradskyella sp.]
MKPNFLFLICILFTFSAKAQQISFEDWGALIRKGDSAAYHKNDQLAISYYGKAILSKTNWNNTLTKSIGLDRLNVSFKKLGQETDAEVVKAYKAYALMAYSHNNELLLKINSALDTAWNNETSLLQAYSDVLYNYQSEQKLDKSDVVVYQDLALITNMIGHHENAIYYFQEWKNLDTTGVADFAENHIISALHYGDIYKDKNNIDEAINGYLTANAIISDNPEQKAKYFQYTNEGLFYLFRDQNNDDATYYADKLEEFYKATYGENNVYSGYLSYEKAIFYQDKNESDLAQLYYESALLHYIISNNINNNDYKLIKLYYFNFLGKDASNTKKVDILEKELAVYKQLEQKDKAYIKTLTEYISLLHGDDSKLKIYEDALKSALTYYTENKKFESNYFWIFKELFHLYQNNEKHNKNLELLLANESILANIDEQYKHIYGICAVIAFNSNKHSQAIDYIDKALNYYENKNTSYIEQAELLKVKTIALYALNEKEEAKTLFYTHKKRLEEENLQNTNEYADLLFLQKNFEDKGFTNNSIDTIENTLKIYETSGDINSYNYFSVVSDYAQLLAKQQNYDQAVPYYLKVYDFYINQLENELRYKSASSRDYKINNSVLKVFNEIQFLNYKLEKKNKNLNEKALDIALLSKSLKLNITNYIFEKLRDLNDEYINETIQFVNKSLLSYSSSYDWYKQLKSEEIDAGLKENKTIIEGAYASLMDSYFREYDEKLLKAPDFNTINLDENTAFIDYIRARDFDGNATYLAYIYTSKQKNPIIISLGKEELLKKLTDLSTLQNLSYETRGAIGRNKYVNGKKLFEFVWQPLQQHIENYKQIYFSLDGLLHKIPLASIQNKDGIILAEKYKLRQLSTIQSLLSVNKQATNNKDIVCIGGIGFGEVEDKQNQLYNYLPGTLAEVKAIKDLLPHSKLLTGQKATEDYFRNLSGNSPSVLHIATHGFYFKQDSLANGLGKHFKISENPMKRSGLLLSNGNIGLSTVIRGVDGVITADEISNLDLSNTDLVVLSACETGLGDIEGSEGVYGLQRAFKMAGVKNIMMSLWEVPDKETAEFMTLFYTNWLSGENIRTAFRNTQLEMAAKYKDDPQKWAAFVLIE